jgi:hypothetical protein
MLDISESIQSEANIKLCITFIKAVFMSFSAGLGSSVRFGFVTFSASATVVFDFAKYTSASQVRTKIIARSHIWKNVFIR